jgi:type VI protein secretion system component VasK
VFARPSVTLSTIVRIAAALSVLVVAAWFLLFRSIDGGPTAAALTQGFLTLCAIAAIGLIWLSVGTARLVRAARDARRDVFGERSTSGQNPKP